MPISEDFFTRLNSALKAMVDHYGTPFHVYDERGIRETCRRLNRVFSRGRVGLVIARYLGDRLRSTRGTR